MYRTTLYHTTTHLKGMISFWVITFFRYLVALRGEGLVQFNCNTTVEKKRVNTGPKLAQSQQDRPVEGHGLDGLGCLARVLEVDAQVGALVRSREKN